MVSRASKSSFFLAPKVGIPISFSSSSVRVAKVGKSISWRTNMSAYLNCTNKGEKITGRIATNDAHDSIWCMLQYKLESDRVQKKNLNTFQRDSKEDPLGESLIGEKNWETISNILLCTVLPSIPGLLFLRLFPRIIMKSVH